MGQGRRTGNKLGTNHYTIAHLLVGSDILIKVMASCVKLFDSESINFANETRFIHPNPEIRSMKTPGILSVALNMALSLTIHSSLHAATMEETRAITKDAWLYAFPMTESYNTWYSQGG